MNTPSKLAYRTCLLIALVAAILGGAAITSSFAEDTKPAPTPEQEAKLISTLTNATLKGRWALIKDGQLGPEKEDAYEILSAKKLEGDHWQINARFQYGGRAIDLPIPALLKWAGDTPVLIFEGIGGLLMATVATLFFVPVVFSLLHRHTPVGARVPESTPTAGTLPAHA